MRRNLTEIIALNFFGHVAVAGWNSSTPEYLLGSMLPDLASMCGNAAKEVLDLELRAGVQLHQTTDEIFHASPTFIHLCSCAIEMLDDQGIKRGSARAAAHAAVELLLDGTLIDDRAARAGYAAALRVGEAESLESKIIWRTEYRPEHWRRLLLTLRSANIPDGYANPDFVVERLVNLLALRPNLALDRERETPIISRWV